MTKGYVVAHIDVDDDEGYRDYIAVVTEAVAEFGGRFLVHGGSSELKEGSLRSRHAVQGGDKTSHRSAGGLLSAAE